MTVDLPPRPQMADKARLLVDRHRLPDVLRGGAQTVDDSAPVPALPGQLLDLFAQQAGQSRCRRRQGPFDQRHRGSGGARPVPSRQKPPARQGVDRPVWPRSKSEIAVSTIVNPGADQQHRRVRVEIRERIRHPGIRPIAVTVVEAGIGDCGRLRAGSCRPPAPRDPPPAVVPDRDRERCRRGKCVNHGPRLGSARGVRRDPPRDGIPR